MTERERVAEIESVLVEFAASRLSYEAAAERIHAIYTDGLEPVAWDVQYECGHGGLHYEGNAYPIVCQFARAHALTKPGSTAMKSRTALYTHAPRSEAEARLRKALDEMVQAMRDYEMDVDEPPPYRHRDMMARARRALSDTQMGESVDDCGARRQDGRGDSPEGGTAPNKTLSAGFPDTPEEV